MVKTKNTEKVIKYLKEWPELFTFREKRILVLRYGLNGNSWHTLEEVGSKMNVTRERIRQIEARCIFKINQNEKTVKAGMNYEVRMR